uniref:Uncharacterized protein n=1 Tax=Anguilla anguilla TaxID=7936 RepID=A0A0E9U7G1_ANGAN
MTFDLCCIVNKPALNRTHGEQANQLQCRISYLISHTQTENEAFKKQF